jgi:hypothetical protein
MPPVIIHVDANAAPGGDGTSPSTAFRTIKAAVDDANARGGGVTIRIEPGTYVEPINTTIVQRENVKISGRTVLQQDARGIPTGEVADVVRYKPASPSGPADSTLLKVLASGFEVEGVVFDGGTPRPLSGSLYLLWVDGSAGAATRTLLGGISIRGNCFQDTVQALRVSHANAVVRENYIARNNGGLQCGGGFADPAHPEREMRVVLERNRIVDTVNIGAVFGGHPSVKASTEYAGPGASHVQVVNNDFAGNSDCREPISPGVYYPQRIQYGAVVFNVMHGVGSDPAQTARIDADIRGNTFFRNAYAMAMAIRVPVGAGMAKYELAAVLSGNTYCANGLNDLFVGFNLPSQSHLGPPAQDGPFRHAVGAVCTVDATGDGLTIDDVDRDHPPFDPRLPLSAPGTLPLGNTFVFNDATIPPHAMYPESGVSPKVTRPADTSVPIPMVDRKPPRILSATATPAVIWPPNNTMVPVDIAVKVNGGCDPDPAVAIESVTSNEPSGVGSGPDPQWELSGPLSIKLRAARRGNGNGRTYTVKVRCTDHVGKYATSDVTVTVPRDHS